MSSPSSTPKNRFDALMAEYTLLLRWYHDLLLLDNPLAEDPGEEDAN